MNANGDPRESSPWPRLLAGMLVAAAVLRAILVWRGGQFFWPDEQRYMVAVEAVGRLRAGETMAALHGLLATVDHLFFKIVSLVPAALEAYGLPSPVVPALFFSSFSVLNIYLVWRIARQAGAPDRQAVTAAWLLALSNTHFAYARHLLPYDLAMTFGLLALAAGWSGDGWRRSLLTGVCAGLGFLAYDGAWVFGAVVLLVHVLMSLPRIGHALRRAGWAFTGLVIPVLAVILAARALGHDLVGNFLRSFGTGHQGDYGRGWSRLCEYFWTAEGLLFPLAVVGMALVVAGACVTRRVQAGLHWVAGAMLLVAGMIVLSDAWPVFVIYGGAARMVVPFACLAGAFALERCWQSGSVLRQLATAALVIVGAQAAVNFAQPLALVFPADFRLRAIKEARRLQEGGEKRQLVVIHADKLLGGQAHFTSLPDHDVMLMEPNPLQFRPYQFEGLTDRQRAELAANDTRMKLIAVNRPWSNQPLDLRRPYPGVVQLVLRLPRDRTGEREPLLVSGSTGVGDLIYLIYDSERTIRLGLDHWSVFGMESEPIEIDYTQPLRVTLSTGPLHDPAVAIDAPFGPTNPNLRRWLYAAVNGRVIWSRPAVFHSAAPSSISFGVNGIGGSTCGAEFKGEVISVKSLVLAPIPAYKHNLAQPYPGAVQLTLRLLAPRQGANEPLVSSGTAGAADLIYMRYEAPGRIRIGYDHWGSEGLLSDPIAVDDTRPIRVKVSMGSLFGPMTPLVNSAGVPWRDWLHVEVNDAVVRSCRGSFYPAEPKSIVFAANDVGATTCEPRFTGEIIEIGSIDPPARP